MRLSSATAAALTAELDALSRHGIALDDQMSHAAEQGDNSENVDVWVVMAERRLMNDRTGEISRALSAHANEPAPNGTTVRPATLLTLSFGGSPDEELIYGSIEEGPVHGHEVISPDSPLGQGLLNVAAGQIVSVDIAGRSIEVTVVGIEPLP